MADILKNTSYRIWTIYQGNNLPPCTLQQESNTSGWVSALLWGWVGTFGMSQLQTTPFQPTTSYCTRWPYETWTAGCDRTQKDPLNWALCRQPWQESLANRKFWEWACLAVAEHLLRPQTVFQGWTEEWRLAMGRRWNEAVTKESEMRLRFPWLLLLKDESN